MVGRRMWRRIVNLLFAPTSLELLDYIVAVEVLPPACVHRLLLLEILDQLTLLVREEPCPDSVSVLAVLLQHRRSSILIEDLCHLCVDVVEQAGELRWLELEDVEVWAGLAEMAQVAFEQLSQVRGKAELPHARSLEDGEHPLLTERVYLQFRARLDEVVALRLGMHIKEVPPAQRNEAVDHGPP